MLLDLKIGLTLHFILFCFLYIMYSTGCTSSQIVRKEVAMSSAPPPPAPFVGPNLDQVVKLVAKNDFPIDIGHGQPQAVIYKKENEFFLVELELNKNKAAEVSKLQAEEGYFMPEHLGGALVEGEVLIQADSSDNFITLLKGIWKKEWER